MTELCVVLLELCGGTFSACSGLLKVTFFVLDMVSNDEGVKYSLETRILLFQISLMLHRIVIFWGMWCLQKIESNL